MKNGLRGVVIGAGDRGANAYVPYLLRHPEEGRIVAVAEPDAARRAAFAGRFGLPPAAQFDDWRDLLAGPQRADFAVVATPDADHFEPARLAMQEGYHVLLEKPMAVSEEECRELVRVAAECRRVLQVCHVLRYAPFYRRIKDIIASGALGDLVTIQHSENVSYFHYAHSYCRGSWRNVAESSPMILAKSCHDLDLLCWFADSEPARLSSLARPSELREENAPEGAPLHCSEGCVHAPVCPYDAVASYREVEPLMLDVGSTRRPFWLGPAARAFVRIRRRLLRNASPGLESRLRWRGWPTSVITNDLSSEGLATALSSTRYGRCVYRIGDNDQVSSQNVIVLFRNGVNATFTMHGSSHREGRETRIDGTRGSLQGGFYNVERRLELTDHKTGRRRSIRFPASISQHGGGDHRLFAGFLAAARGEAAALTSAEEALMSHLMAFAADRAQRDGTVEDFP
jgi:predicted dehydrogenase